MRTRGRTEFHSETGTEGGYWAVQADDDVHGRDQLDGGRCPWGAERCPVEDGAWHEHARYDGLHVLRDGDRLTVFEPDGEAVRWRGEVELVRHPAFTEDADGMWIHADQAGVQRLEWAAMFFEGLPCELERDE